MKIAFGNKRTAKKWRNDDITWAEFTDRIKNTQRTTETVEEYRKMKKAQQDDIKDVGGFVGGHLKEGLRKKGYVLSRSMLTLDIDYGETTVWDEITMFFDFKCCIYSTHKHTPDKPRLRLIIPLSREVSEEEYAAVGRKIAQEIGIDMFDDSTYQAHRLMYWPSTSSDGEFVFEEQDGPLLDPDEYLAKYDDWHDVSTWPTSSRQSAVVKRSIKEQADPLEKPGVVGAFCRAYSISEAIEAFLSDVYEPSVMEGRYDYVPADSSAGVQVFDGKFAYSHHATDPACDMLLNAFDLVRVHKFGNDDEKKSFKAMQEFAASDEGVKRQLSEDRRASAAEDFDYERSDDIEWETALELEKSGAVKDTLNNLVLIIRNDKGLQNIAFNCHRDGIDARGGLPWEQIKPGWSDSDYAALKVYLSQIYSLYAPTKTKDAVLAVAAERSYHPVREYLDALPEWDKTPRAEMLLIDYLGAENTAYTRAVARKTLAAAVARIYEPGSKFDSVLILNGPQGIGKSTLFAKLAGEWFSDALALTDMKDKTGPEKLQGYWILELGELAGMRKADIETVKSFISRVDDKYRAAYGLSVESHPRQCIIVGSTNSENGFLRDITGNRRFWPVKVSADSPKKPWQLTKYEIEQIWAETLELYRNGEKLYLEGAEADTAIEEQADAMETDEREGLVREYLNTLLPEDWQDMSLFERRNYLAEGDFGGGKTGKVPRTRVCNLEIWCECFGREASSMKSADSYAISAIMQKIEGWEKGGTQRFGSYGIQRGYIRKM
ncbi:MAG: hypothetical protein J1F03_00105 [Oscillospiraceae bacterium]|nr:hypothetical protein [Oscillospiraceae bacterium]